MSRDIKNLQAETKQFLRYLQNHPELRTRICAPENRTLLYAGKLIRNAWQELVAAKGRPEFAELCILPEVLSSVPAPNSGHDSLHTYVQAVCAKVPWEDDGFTLWRALSGIFASQAKGRVSFYIGDSISGDMENVENRRVFAVTELPVLDRNPNLDALTRDVLAYYMRCLKNKNQAMNFSFIGGIGQF